MPCHALAADALPSEHAPACAGRRLQQLLALPASSRRGPLLTRGCPQHGTAAAIAAAGTLAAGFGRSKGSRSVVARASVAAAAPQAVGGDFHVAPMVNITNRHFRKLMRLIAPRAVLWTEMVKARDLLVAPGSRKREPSARAERQRRRLLDFDPCEHPLVLQLAGAEEAQLQQATKLGASWGYTDINLNCGCPKSSARGAHVEDRQVRHGAGLMLDAPKTAALVTAMLEAAAPEVNISVKCRLAARIAAPAGSSEEDEPDEEADYASLLDFVDCVHTASGIFRFVVHERVAILGGSFSMNREAPPLRPGLARRLAMERPQLEVVANGGLLSPQAAVAAWEPPLRGIMVARAVRDQPYSWSLMEAAWRRPEGLSSGPVLQPPLSRRKVLEAYLDYAGEALVDEHRASQGERNSEEGLGPRVAVGLPLLNLFAGEEGEGLWRDRMVEWKNGTGQATGQGLVAAVWHAAEGLSPESLDLPGVRLPPTKEPLSLTSDVHVRAPRSARDNLAPRIQYVHPDVALSPDSSPSQPLRATASRPLEAGALLVVIAPPGALTREQSLGLLGRTPNCEGIRASTEQVARRLGRLMQRPEAMLGINSLCLVSTRPFAAGDTAVLARSEAATVLQELIAPVEGGR
ncbi:unnamed protein product [Polarella glacialis]|uniref:DUS-like FMN-binding domain-containing protein n=1 Tax=Polarella glacialis TaxID=89957 RepID=A0A813H9Q2_POLGL|nr:unnamed protein product [Polarella glacialis]